MEEKVEKNEAEPEEVNKIIAALGDAAKSISVDFGNFMRALPNNKISKHQMSKRGAKHTHNPVGRARIVLPMTPAQYRRFHFGKLQKENK